ncbi:MAG: hypothetical protein K0S08_1027 [Gammaproteobacteria bacterium]|nr:hypothetical protein [Gammaproteobacteria bacterium]
MRKTDSKKPLIIGATFFVLINSMNLAMAQQRDIQFSNIKSLSPKASLSQCKSLFSEIILPAPTAAAASGKEDFIKSTSTPVTINNQNALISLRATKTIPGGSNKLLFRSWEGVSRASFDNGKTFNDMRVVADGIINTGDYSGQGRVDIGGYCEANYSVRAR